MVVDKDAVTAVLRAQGEHDRAAQAESALPRTVDTELDALTLHHLGLSVSEVEAAVAPADAEGAEPVG
jgi:hypothetical protein